MSINSCLSLSFATTTSLSLVGFAACLCAVVCCSLLMDGKPAKAPKNRKWFKNNGMMGQGGLGVEHRSECMRAAAKMEGGHPCDVH